MLQLVTQKDFSYPLLIWLVFLTWYWLIGDALLASPRTRFHNLVTDHAFWLFNDPPPEAHEVTIVAIDQNSRRRMGLKWPWKRSVTAQLIRNIAAQSPRVIGLDVIFSGESEKEEDLALATALQSHPRIVLGYLLDPAGHEGPCKDFSAAASCLGFVNKRSHHGVVDAMRPYQIGKDGRIDLSIETAVLREYLGVDLKETAIGDERICLGNRLCIPTRNGNTAINYLVYHSSFNTVSATQVLEGKIDPSLFRDKIVLVGATDPIIHDELQTPLGTFPGVAILGNAIVMFLSQRFLQALPSHQSLVLAFCLGLIIIVINKKFSFFPAMLASLALIGLTYFALIYLRSKDLDLPCFLILFSAATAFLAYNVHKYANLIYVSNRLKNQAIVDPLTGLLTARYFLLRLQEQVKSKKPVALIGLRLADYPRLAMELTFEQIRGLTKRLGRFVSSEVQGRFNRASVALLAADTVAITVEGDPKEKIAEFVRRLLEASKDAEWELADRVVRNRLQACLMVKPRNQSVEQPDVLNQMNRLFRRGTTHRVVIDHFRGSGDERKGKEKLHSEDVLDFLAYDWEERNKDLEEGLKGLLEANKHLERLNWGTLTALARAIDAKSTWTAGHSERVTQLSLRIGTALGLSEDKLNDLHRAGLLHDIGKIATPPEILDKPDRLSEEERRIICEHPAEGARILEPIEDFASAVPIVMEHHERFDGAGYPRGLAGEAISLGARILAVADVYDAVTSDRPYRRGMPFDRALEIIKQGSGTQFDPAVVEAFLTTLPDQRHKAIASSDNPIPTPSNPEPTAQKTHCPPQSTSVNPPLEAVGSHRN